MTPSHRLHTGPIKRMAEDMTIRHLADATVDRYTYHAAQFARFFGKPLDQATPEDARSFQLDMIENRKLGWSSFNQVVEFVRRCQP